MSLTPVEQGPPPKVTPGRKKKKIGHDRVILGAMVPKKKNFFLYI